ncbi:oligosaccharide flippase family protein [Tropicimonas isoalkanivorans]|uniref:Membrane protein involved in the export of O-antigen and teichoic acid n=1 Tax=Tropicimonas isoalkanivorans TaxID=441112 RepID=A0A1I1QA49_9RHOB|nr:oligosaccharide flippase family protein [Tropicimonas isoalkanivorans]SFD18971.1 Membrane protein involved in the export of O-antigen and teichoic acid [Tropicimonas isoalkanivorans]
MATTGMADTETPGEPVQAEASVLNQSVAKNMAIVVAGKAIAVVAGVAATVLTTRHLGPADYGRYREVLNYVIFGSVFVDLGLYMILLRELGKPGDHSRYLGAAMALRLLATGAALFAASLAGLFLLEDPVVRTGMFVGAVYFTAYQASELLIAVFQRHLRQDRQVMAEIFGSIALVALTVLVVALGGGAVGMLAALAGSAAVTLALAWRWAALLEPFRPLVDPAYWRHLVAEGLPFAGSRILLIVIIRGDMLVMALTQPSRALGLYGIPTKIFEIVTSMPPQFSGLLMSSFTEAAARRDVAQLSRNLSEALSVMLWFGIGVVLTTTVFAEEIVVLIGGRAFSGARDAMVVIGPAMAFSAVASVLRFALAALERQRHLLMLDVAAAAIAFGLFLLLIPIYSGVGAAVARTAVEAFTLAGMGLLAHRAGIRFPVAGTLFATAVAGVAGALAMASLARATGLWWLGFLLGGVLYSLVAIATGLLPRARILGWLRAKFAPHRS